MKKPETPSIRILMATAARSLMSHRRRNAETLLTGMGCDFDRSARDFLARIRWMRQIELLARTLRIYHFHLGKAAG